VFDEFTRERKAPSVPDDVVDDIVAATGGHMGCCMLAGNCIDNVLSRTKKHADCGSTTFDMGSVWWHPGTGARRLFSSHLAALPSVDSMVSSIKALDGAGRTAVVTLIAKGRSRTAVGGDAAPLDAAAWAEWSTDVRTGDVGQLLLQFSVFDVNSAAEVCLGAAHIVSAALAAALRGATGSFGEAVERPFSVDDLTAMPMSELLSELVAASFGLAMHTYRGGAVVKRSFLGGAHLPAEAACYLTALHITATAWLGTDNVDLQPRLGAETRNIDLRLRHRGKTHAVEIVSHERVTEVRHGVVGDSTVEGHLIRIRDVYAPLCDGAVMWLINFDRVQEDHADDAAGAGTGTLSKVTLFNRVDFPSIWCMNVLVHNDLTAIASVELWSAPRACRLFVTFPRDAVTVDYGAFEEPAGM
jgi:hypothetical protein